MKFNTLKKIARITLLAPILYISNTSDLIAPETIYKLTKDPRKIVFLDPGHGMSNKELLKIDYGGGSYKDYREADIVLQQAKKVKAMLDPGIYKVILTREDNMQNVPLVLRKMLANEEKADIFVSFHTNNNRKSPKTHGFEVYWRENKSKELALLAAKNLETMTNIPKNWVRKNNYAVLKDLNCPGILIESGYPKYKKDRESLLDTIPDVERAIAKTIEDYFQERKPLTNIYK